MTGQTAAASTTDRYWRNGLYSLLLLAIYSCSTIPPASANETTISNARTLLVDGVYRIGMQVELELSETIREALQSGVPLVLEFRIEVVREREWLWPLTVAELRQRFRIEYHALSRRYLVHNYSSGVQYSYRMLKDALEYIGNVYDLPLIDANLLQADQDYRVRVKAGLDVESLPTPIRPWAYLGSDWSLDSDWYQWPLQP